MFNILINTTLLWKSTHRCIWILIFRHTIIYEFHETYLRSTTVTTAKTMTITITLPQISPGTRKMSVKDLSNQHCFWLHTSENLRWSTSYVMVCLSYKMYVAKFGRQAFRKKKLNIKTRRTIVYSKYLFSAH